MTTVHLTEAQWQEQVLGMARLFGWRCAHFRSARTEKGWRTPVQADGAGFPDLVLVRGTELIFAELKANRGRATEAQHEWVNALAHVAAAVAGVEYCDDWEVGKPRMNVYFWRPRDADAVERRLRG